MTASQNTVSLPPRFPMRRLSAALLGCVAAVAVLTACDRSVPATGTLRSEDRAPLEGSVEVARFGAKATMLTPISRTYSVESHELIEISHFEDGSMRYAPTGLIVVSASSTPTSTVSTARE